MHPLIAITPRYDLSSLSWLVPTDYTQHLQQQQATVLIIDPTTETERLDQILSVVDGLLLSGGTDINPALYGEQPQPACTPTLCLRDTMELHLAQMAIQNNLPCLGICRGNQILNVAAGGTLFQDLQSQVSWQISHTPNNAGWTNPAHTVNVIPKTLLSKIIGQPSFPVNSYHHQAVKTLGNGFILAANSPDGVCEAIEHIHLDFCLGIQWHPERRPLNDPISTAIFKSFVDACRRR